MRFALTVGQGVMRSLVDVQGVQFPVEPVDISASHAGAAASFVYRPGDTTTPLPDGVYTTTAALSAALATVDASAYKIVSVDDSLAAAHIVATGMPAGGWPGFENVEFTSGGPDAAGAAIANLIFDQGAKLADVTHLNADTVNLTFNSTATVIPTTTSNLSVQFRGVSTSNGAGGVGLADIGAGKSVSYRGYSSAIGGQLFTGSATSIYACLFFDGSSIVATGINGTAGGTVLLVVDGSSQGGVNPTQTPAASTNVLNPTPTFVYRPGAVGLQDGNVYTVGESLRLAMNLMPGQPRVLQVDDSLAAAHMTAGAWDQDNVTWRGQNSSATETLIVDDGVILTSSYLKCEAGLFVSCRATTASPWIPTSFAQLICREQANVSSTAGSKPFLEIAGAAASNSVVITESSTSIGDGTHNAVTIDAGRALTFVMCGPGQANAHAFGGAGTLNATISAESIFNAQDTTTVNVTNAANASLVAITVATAGNWNPVPTTSKAAIDQLAASNTTQAAGNTGTGTASLSVTTGNITKAKNGKMRVRASALISTSAAATLTVALTRDATAIGTNKTVVAGAAITAADIGIDFIDTAPDNNPHAYTCTWSVTAGAITCAASSAQASVVEDS